MMAAGVSPTRVASLPLSDFLLPIVVNPEYGIFPIIRKVAVLEVLSVRAAPIGFGLAPGPTAVTPGIHLGSRISVRNLEVRA